VQVDMSLLFSDLLTLFNH